MVATVLPSDRRALLIGVLGRIEALERDAAELKGLVQRIRRGLDVAAVLPDRGVGPPPAARWVLVSRRRALRLSQAAAGREAGVSRSQLQSLEAGTRSGVDTMAAYLAALDRLEGARR